MVAFTNNGVRWRDANDAKYCGIHFRAGKLNLSGDFANTLTDIKYVLK
jgi:hypothetical protein